MLCADLSKNGMQLTALRRSAILKPEAFPDGKIPEIYKNSTDSAGNLIADSGMSSITCRFHYQLQNGKSFKRSFTCFLTDEAAELITELQAMPVYQDTLTIGDKLKTLDILPSAPTWNDTISRTIRSIRRIRLSERNMTPMHPKLRTRQ